MPHKKAKLSVRTQERDKKGMDWAPGHESLANEAIPKSASRILDAHKIRAEYRAKKRKLEEEKQTPKAAKRTKVDDKSLKILPGESIQHFNRRVEDDLRPLVKSAIETGRAQARGAVRDEKEKKKAVKAQQKDSKSKPSSEDSPSKGKPEPASKPKASSSSSSSEPQPSQNIDRHANRPKEFALATNSAPKRLNDVAMAPPELNALPRMTKNITGPTKAQGVVSMAQKAMMEQERLGAIARYRELNLKRAQASKAS